MIISVIGSRLLRMNRMILHDVTIELRNAEWGILSLDMSSQIFPEANKWVSLCVSNNVHLNCPKFHVVLYAYQVSVMYNKEWDKGTSTSITVSITP